MAGKRVYKRDRIGRFADQVGPGANSGKRISAPAPVPPTALAYNLVKNHGISSALAKARKISALKVQTRDQKILVRELHRAINEERRRGASAHAIKGKKVI